MGSLYVNYMGKFWYYIVLVHNRKLLNRHILNEFHHILMCNEENVLK